MRDKSLSGIAFLLSLRNQKAMQYSNDNFFIFLDKELKQIKKEIPHQMSVKKEFNFWLKQNNEQLVNSKDLERNNNYSK